MAGMITRFLAWLVDFFIIAVLASTLSTITVSMNSLSPGLAGAINIIGYFIISIGYNIILEWRLKGQTFGKRLMKIRVMDDRGLNLRFNQIVLRNLVRVVDSLPLFYIVGGLSALISNRSQRTGDWIAGTIVIDASMDSMPEIARIEKTKYNSFKTLPHLSARLRQKISPMEIHLVLEALSRRDSFDPASRVRLFHELADHLKSKVRFPAHIEDNLTDEQYLRNAADCICDFHNEQDQ